MCIRDSVLIAGAATHVAREFLAQFIARITFARAQQVLCRHDEARRAKTALHGSLIDECLLNIGNVAVDIDESFNRQ